MGDIRARRSGVENEVAADLADLLREFGHEQADFTVVGVWSQRRATHSVKFGHHSPAA
jgi:hypothetical protein